MAKRSFSVPTFTPTAVADTTTMTNATYMALNGGSSTQIINVIEIYQGGLASASSINLMVFARSSTVGVTPTALAAPNSDGPMHSATAALAAAPVSYVAAGTGPQRSALTTAARLPLSFNAFGGIVRWVAAPGEEWTIVGNVATTGESTLSAFTGATSGAMSGMIVYEPF